MTAEAPSPTRNCTFPADFFARGSTKRMIRTWERGFEWWMFLVLLAREALDAGRLLQAGKSLNPKDLAVIHDNPIDPNFIDWLLDEGLVVTTTDRFGRPCLAIDNWSEWYKPRSHQPDAKADQKARERAKSSDELPLRQPPPPRVSQDVARGRQVSQPVAHVATQPIPIRTDPDPSSSSKVDPNSGVSPGTTTTESKVIKIFHAISPSGSWNDGRRDEVQALFCNVGKQLTHGVVTANDCVAALVYARDATLHGLDIGAVKKSPWRYAVSTAADKLAQVVERRSDRQRAKSRGQPDPGPLQFTPPEPKGG